MVCEYWTLMLYPVLISSLTRFQDIGGDFVVTSPPKIGRFYRLVISLTTNSTVGNELFGVQLRLREKPGGWIREYDAQLITAHLNAGHKVIAQIVGLSEYQWKGETCFWGTVRWEVVT